MGATNRTRQKKKSQGPAFDEAALAQLTSKIDKTLPKADDDDKEDSPKRKRKHAAPQDERDSKRRQTVTSAPAQKQPAALSDKKSKNASAGALLDEILALGGDEADLELVANIDSDNEGGDTPDSKESQIKPVDKSFQDELAKFASALGFDSVRNDDVNTDESEEEEEEDVEEEEVAEEEEVSEEEEYEDDESEIAEEEKAPPPPPPQEVTSRKGKQSVTLVSKSSGKDLKKTAI